MDAFGRAPSRNLTPHHGFRALVDDVDSARTLSKDIGQRQPLVYFSSREIFLTRDDISIFIEI
jgi:hypothetical protein